MVQAASTEAETFLLGLARETAFIAGVVGWTDLRLRRRGPHPRGGPRSASAGPAPDDPGYHRRRLDAERGHRPGGEGHGVRGLRFDALVLPRHLPRLATFAARYADLPMVIDHGAKPFIATREIEPWARDMRRLAAETPLVCKLSGLATEAAPGWTADDLRPYVDVLIEAFGPRRLMWGSDWPVLRLAGDYAGWLETAQTLTAGLSTTTAPGLGAPPPPSMDEAMTPTARDILLDDGLAGRWWDACGSPAPTWGCAPLRCATTA